MDQLYCSVLLALLLPLLFVVVYKVRPSSNVQEPRLRLPPGPWRLPVIGSAHHLGGALPHRAMRDLARRHGPLMLLQLGEVPTLVVSSAEAAREVMRTHDAAFATRALSPAVRIIVEDGIGVVFAPYGEHWRHLRKICVVELLGARRVLSFRRVREDEVSRLVGSLAASGAAYPVNLSERLSVLIADITIRTIAGDKLKDRAAFQEKLTEAIKIVAGFGVADLFPSSRLVCWLTGVAPKARAFRRYIFEFMGEIIEEHKRRRAAGAPEEEEDLVDVLLRIQKDGGLQFALTTGTIKAVLLDIFGAGSETSATTLQWAMTELMRTPAVLRRVQAEVRRVHDGSTTVTEEHLANLHYLQLVIKETLRLHPPSPLVIPRRCQETSQILGYDVLKGTTVLVNAWAISTDPRYWEAPEEFVPERFEGSTVDFKGTDFEFIPFGAGRRICPGIAFGLASIELALASLLFHFDWVLPDGAAPGELDMTEVFGVTVRRKQDLWLHAIPHDI